MAADLLAARRRGFTLIELLVVLGIVALLLTLAVPRYFLSLDKAREAVLADNLRKLRATIDQFHGDTGCYPDSLEQLVEKNTCAPCPSIPSPTATPAGSSCRRPTTRRARCMT